MKLRVLFATHSPADGKTAVFRSVAGQARHLELEGHEVDLLTRNDLASPSWSRLDPILLPFLLAWRGLAGYNVVVFHSYLGWAFHLLRRWLDPGRRVATITWFHGLEPLYHRAVSLEYDRAGWRLSRRFRLLHHVILPRLLRIGCRRSDAVLCFNSAEARYLTENGWAQADRVHQVFNGVEQGCFRARRHRAVARRLLFVGQWLPAKGTRYLVEAFTSLAALHDFELACVGTGASAEQVRSEFPAVVRPQVSVVPRVDRTQLYEQLDRADLFLFPTLSEGFSCALLEAMAAGLPVVTTPVGAAPDVLQNGRNGVLVPWASAPALTEAVMRLANDIDARSALGTAAARTAQRFTAGAACEAFAHTLRVIFERRDATAGRAMRHTDAA